MELLSQIIIPRPEGHASIQLLQGDLTAIPQEFAVDILAISAFRGDYRTFKGTLMAALHKADISVADLANDKEIDLLSQLSCWLSKPLTEAQQARFNIKKILCFEPIGSADDAQTEVENLFRGINTFALDDDHDEIAMPILSTGNRGFPLEVMLPAMLDTALFWLESGLPLKSLKFVLYGAHQVDICFPIFENVRRQYDLKKSAQAGQISAGVALNEINELNNATAGEYALPKLAFALQEMNQAETAESQPNVEVSRGLDAPEPLSTPMQYDYFISYSHRHTAAVQEFVNALLTRNSALSIFYDRTSIPPGGLWIKMISDAIQNSKNVVCILTPEYSKSDVCWDEFQCAYIMEKRKKLLVRTINYCNDVDLPPILAIRSYIDCTEGDLVKLKGAVEELVKN